MSDLPSTKTGAAKRVTVVGTGYVGISNAVLLAQRNRVIALDIDAQKVEQLNARISPNAYAEIEEYLANRPLDLTATPDKAAASDGADQSGRRPGGESRCEYGWEAVVSGGSKKKKKNT